MTDPVAAMAVNLAQNLRYIRQRRNLTQQDLAKLCGVPRSTVGQIETGSCNPTLSVLARVAMSLHVSIEELLSTPQARCAVFPKGTLPTSSRGRGGTVQVQKLLPDPIPGMEIDRMELPPGARMTGVPHRPGTREYLCCERGQLTFWAAGERYTLAPGDVAAFQGDQAHSYQNDGAIVAVGFSVVTLAPVPQTSAVP
jgi:XRE family transcriptional regulator, regulator of sulfur utilization